MTVAQVHLAAYVREKKIVQRELNQTVAHFKLLKKPRQVKVQVSILIHWTWHQHLRVQHTRHLWQHTTLLQLLKCELKRSTWTRIFKQVSQSIVKHRQKLLLLWWVFRLHTQLQFHAVKLMMLSIFMLPTPICQRKTQVSTTVVVQAQLKEPLKHHFKRIGLEAVLAVIILLVAYIQLTLLKAYLLEELTTLLVKVGLHLLVLALVTALLHEVSTYWHAYKKQPPKSRV